MSWTYLAFRLLLVESEMFLQIAHSWRVSARPLSGFFITSVLVSSEEVITPFMSTGVVPLHAHNSSHRDSLIAALLLACFWCWLVWLILGNQLGNLNINVVQKALEFVVPAELFILPSQDLFENSQERGPPKGMANCIGTLVITEVFWTYRGDHKLCFHALWCARSTCRWKLEDGMKLWYVSCIHKTTCMPFQARLSHRSGRCPVLTNDNHDTECQHKAWAALQE